MTEPERSIEAISQRLHTFLLEKSSAEFGDEAAILFAAAAAAASGGKRLRARFCLAGWQAARNTDLSVATQDRSVVTAAAALELFHAAALVHDDLIDNSDTRRGKPSAHRALASAHQNALWAGNSHAFGRSAAILLGDLLVAWSDDLFEQALEGSAHAANARGEYANMRSEVTIGQFLDVAEESAYRVAPDDTHADRALRIAALKSARYSVARPLAIGAALAGAAAEQQDALAEFAHPLGIAFQLRDDVLGVFGNPAETGKPSGDDLREGKRTVLVAFAREGISTSARRIFDEMLGDPQLTPDQIGSLQRTIADSGALQRVEDVIASSARQADQALTRSELGAAAVADLRALCTAATVRVA